MSTFFCSITRKAVMTRKKAYRGISIAELLVSVVLLGYLFYSIFRLLEPGLRVWRQSDVRVSLQQSTLVAMYRLTNELKESNLNTVTLKRYDPATDRISTLICFASSRDRQGNYVSKKGETNSGVTYDTGEPDWQKYVIYYLDNKSRLRRHETSIVADPVPLPSPSPVHPYKYRNAADMHMMFDPLTIIQINDLTADPAVARSISDLSIDGDPALTDWTGALTVGITALHPDPNPAEQFQMKLETIVRVRYNEKDY
jgi:hypothetical protein